MSEIVMTWRLEQRFSSQKRGLVSRGFAESITQLRAAGCQIIVDDISYATMQFQDDEIGQAINTVTASERCISLRQAMKGI